MHLKDNFLSWK